MGGRIVADRRAKLTGRSGKVNPGPGNWRPKSVFASPEWARLSPYAVKLLDVVHLGFGGRNNGGLWVTFAHVSQYGLRSRSTFEKALQELLHTGWLQRTRQGGRSLPSLYALTFLPIDPVEGSEVPAGPPPHLWKDANADRREVHGSAPARSRRGFGACPAVRVNLPRDTGLACPAVRVNDTELAPRHGTQKAKTAHSLPRRTATSHI